MRTVLALALSACLGYVAAASVKANAVRQEQCPTCPASVQEDGKTYPVYSAGNGSPEFGVYCFIPPGQAICVYNGDGSRQSDSSAGCPTTIFGLLGGMPVMWACFGIDVDHSHAGKRVQLCRIRVIARFHDHAYNIGSLYTNQWEKTKAIAGKLAHPQT
ncbi:hypothetical protein BU15DRAFT_71606 [Melanogaster broomeanus]|nr:hypothetical protein BU15DRAFT_71606 [Melanogaster broomeanus]